MTEAELRARAFIRRTRAATWLAIATLGILARARPPVARAITFALIGTLGIAHGATDDTLLYRFGYRPPGGRLALSAVYGALTFGTFVAARRSPAVARRALFALSWLHFGNGDAAFARACGGRSSFFGETLLRGALPLCIAQTDGRSRVAASIAAAAAIAHAVRGSVADALDLALPTALLLCTPKRLGFAIYFGAWHAVRHTALLLHRDVRGGTFGGRARRFARESVGNVAIAMTAGALAYCFSPAKSGFVQAQNDDVFGALILAITVPHHIAVWLVERRHRDA